MSEEILTKLADSIWLDPETQAIIAEIGVPQAIRNLEEGLRKIEERMKQRDYISRLRRSNFQPTCI